MMPMMPTNDGTKSVYTFQEAVTRKAQVDTIVQATEMIVDLMAIVPVEKHKDMAFMVHRLANLVKTLL